MARTDGRRWRASLDVRRCAFVHRPEDQLLGESVPVKVLPGPETARSSAAAMPWQWLNGGTVYAAHSDDAGRSDLPVEADRHRVRGAAPGPDEVDGQAQRRHLADEDELRRRRPDGHRAEVERAPDRLRRREPDRHVGEPDAGEPHGRRRVREPEVALDPPGVVDGAGERAGAQDDLLVQPGERRARLHPVAQLEQHPLGPAGGTRSAPPARSESEIAISVTSRVALVYLQVRAGRRCPAPGRMSPRGTRILRI